MNAQELFLENGNSAHVWYCSDCKIVATDKERVDNCCKRNNCKYCGKLVEEKHWLEHRECIESNKIEKAEKLDTWDDWVYYNDKYYSNISELIEELQEDEEEIPEYVYVCKIIPFPKIQIDDLLEEIGENSYEGIEDDLHKVDDLSESIDYFNEMNEHLVSYFPDETKMVKTIGYINEH